MTRRGVMYETDRSGGLREAVTLRTALLIFGVLALQLAFILSYVGAFHDPEPRDIPIAVVAPGEAGEQLAAELAALPGNPLDTSHQADDEADARSQIERRKIDGALIVDTQGTDDTLLVASGGGASLSQALTEVLNGVSEQQQRTLTVTDVAPASGGDNRGLSSFYLVVGWCVGGYLCAAALAISRGARPANTPLAVLRLSVLVLYSLVAGVGGAVIAGPVLDALPGSVIQLALVGALVVFATGSATLALQGLFGVVGIGLAILLVVVLGNPSSGGAYAGPLLPPFWDHIGPGLIPGAGTFATRSVAYFDSNAMAGPLLVLAAWAAAGSAVTLAATRLRGRSPDRRHLEPVAHYRSASH